MNAAKKVNVTVQLEPDLLARVDDRAELLDLNRSQYLRRLVKRDLGAHVPEFGVLALNGQAEKAEVPA